MLSDTIHWLNIVSVTWLNKYIISVFGWMEQIYVMYTPYISFSFSSSRRRYTHIHTPVVLIKIALYLSFLSVMATMAVETAHKFIHSDTMSRACISTQPIPGRRNVEGWTGEVRFSLGSAVTLDNFWEWQRGSAFPTNNYLKQWKNSAE